MEEKSIIGIFLLWGFLVVTSIAGWITNVLTVIDLISNDVEITFYGVFCMIGVVVAPLGSLLGFLSWFGLPG